MTLSAVGLVYLAVGFVLWIHAWAQGVTTHTLCGCGDPALFLWFWQWPATALAHGHNPFYSTALFHPKGINLLAQTSVTGMSLPLVPVTWVWGPVASLNVASTLAPALSAFTAFVAIRRWATWTPAAFVGGLLYGFSPFVLNSLEFAHLMTAALMVLPLILIALDEIVVRQRHSALWTGALLGLLVFVQFFLSSELLAITALVVVLGLVALTAVALLTDRAEVRRRVAHAATGIGLGLGLGAVLLAWPVWFALAGPGHLTGLVWPNVSTVGGFIPSSFVTPQYANAHNVFLRLGGYEGATLASSAFLGWSLIAVLVAGTVAFWRDRRLWFFGFVLALCVGCSLGARKGQWEPAHLLAHVPIIDNVIVQRFMAVGFLAAAVMLAVILDRVYRLVAASGPAWRSAAGSLASAAVACIALVPMAVTFGSRLPFVMRPVVLPPWYVRVAPTLPPDKVLLSYPAPFSGIQSAMAWQAVNRMHYSQAGGGGPQGVVTRVGSAGAGFVVLTTLGLGAGKPLPEGTGSDYAAVRHALRVWRVTTVVVSTNPAAPKLQRGRDPLYAAAFMTAALGRQPTVQAGAWVWDHVQAGLSAHAALPVRGTSLEACIRLLGGRAEPVAVSPLLPACVGRAARAGHTAASGTLKAPA